MQIMNLLLKNSAYVSHMMFRAGEPFSISSINLIMEAFQLSEMKVEEIVSHTELNAPGRKNKGFPIMKNITDRMMQ